MRRAWRTPRLRRPSINAWASSARSRTSGRPWGGWHYNAGSLRWPRSAWTAAFELQRQLGDVAGLARSTAALAELCMRAGQLDQGLVALLAHSIAPEIPTRARPLASPSIGIPSEPFYKPLHRCKARMLCSSEMPSRTWRAASLRRSPSLGGSGCRERSVMRQGRPHRGQHGHRHRGLDLQTTSSPLLRSAGSNRRESLGGSGNTGCVQPSQGIHP